MAPIPKVPDIALELRRRIVIAVLEQEKILVVDPCDNEPHIRIRCPGATGAGGTHTTGETEATDCMVYLTGELSNDHKHAEGTQPPAGWVHCFHSSCKELCKGLFFKIIGALRKAEYSVGFGGTLHGVHAHGASVDASHSKVHSPRKPRINVALLPGEPIPPPARTPEQDLMLYLETIFQPADIVSYVTDAHNDKGRCSPSGGGIYTSTARQIHDALVREGIVNVALQTSMNQEAGAWIRHNPVNGVLEEGAKGMRDSNVTAFRFVLVESDVIPREKQLALYKLLNLPCAVIVDSGGKSIHAIVHIDAKDKGEYDKRVDRLYAFLKSNGFDGPGALDTKNKNCGRLSRMPGAMRDGKTQHLIDVNTGLPNWVAFETSVLGPWECAAKDWGTGQSATPWKELDESPEEIPAFPLDYLVGPFRAYVEANATAAGCDPVMIAYHLIASIGACMGSRNLLSIKTGWSEPPVVWAAIVAPSGSLKTPMFNLGLQGIRAMVADWRSDWCGRQREIEDDAFISASEPRLMASDLTPECLLKLLEENRNGLLVAVEELAAWFGGLSKYRRTGNDAACYLPLHSGATLDYDRKTGDNRHIHLKHVTISICGTIQPDILGKCLGDENFQNGLAARFLFAMPDVPARTWKEDVSDPNLEKNLKKAFVRLLELRPSSSDGDDDKSSLWEFEQPARDRFIPYFNQNGQEIDSAVDERVRSLLSKLEGACARVALIRAGMRHAAGQETNRKVALEDVELAIKLVEYAKAQNLRVYERLGDGGDKGYLHKLVVFLQANPGLHTMRDLIKKPPYLPPKHASDLVQKLVEAGKIESVECPTTGKGGRPTTKLRFKPD